MFGQARSKANTKEYDVGYSKIDWSTKEKAKPRSWRSVKVLDGRYDCGINDHDHDTFAQAAACVTGEGK